MSYIIEPSQVFLDRYRLLPADQARLVDVKMKDLKHDPRPVGKTKTAIVGTRDPKRYRLRVGDYRVIYSFDSDTLRIWDVNKRAEVYGRKSADDFQPIRDVPESEISEDDGGLEVLEIGSETGHDWQFFRDQLRRWNSRYEERNADHRKPSVAAEEEMAANSRDIDPTPLPRRITHDLLRRIGISRKYHVALAACRTDVDLVQAITDHGVPGDVVDRVFNVVAEPDDAVLTKQPRKRLREVEDLTRFYDGDLIDLQIALDPTQKQMAMSITGSTGSWLINGAPGTGKSTILLEAAVDLYRTMRESGDEPSILITTYTSALVTALEAQLDRILPGPRPGLHVRTTDSIVVQILYVAANAGLVPRMSGKTDASLQGILRPVTYDILAPDYLQQSLLPENDNKVSLSGEYIPFEPLHGMSWQYLLDEIETVIVGRNMVDRDDYLTAPRLGRRVGLTERQRLRIWDISQSFTRELNWKQWTTWARRRQLAADLLERGDVTLGYDAVFVDEAQDLQPNAIRMLVEIAKVPDRGVQHLTLSADMNQTIYGSGMSWVSIHPDLRLQGRSRRLTTNHRSTRQIVDAARAYLSGAELDTDKSNIEHLNVGPVPCVITGIEPKDEIDAIIDFFSTSCGQIERDIDLCAVLVPSDKRGIQIQEDLTKRNIHARFMKRGDVDLSFPGVKIVTRHTAKGLEFPIVALSLVDGIRHIGGDGDESTETRLRQRRVNHMAMTRAMRSLLVTLPRDFEPDLMKGIAEPLWRVETVTA